MTAIVVRVALSAELIDLAEHEALVGHRAAGAVVGFSLERTIITSTSGISWIRRER